MASLALNYKISALDPGSYHWLNLLLHLANTALVFFFVRALSGGRMWTSVLTALLFGIHPMHVESVAWISERKDVLYTLFYLLGLLAYLRYLEGRRLWLAMAWVFFVLSAASKAAAVVFPLTLLLIDWFRRRPLRAGALLEKIPFFAVAAFFGILTLRAQTSVGAVHAALWTPLQKTLFASVGTVIYVAKLFVPVHLSAVYPLPATATTQYSVGYYLAPFAVLLFIAAAILVGRKARPILFGVAFFFINIVLVLQFVSVGAALMAERYTYVPYIGLLLALTWWLDEPQGSPRARWRPWVAGACALLVPFSLAQTWNRTKVFHDPETFWNDTIEKFPGKIVDAYYNRGNWYNKNGRTADALADYARAIDLNPGVPRIWYNRGLLYAQIGKNDSALVSFDHAVALDPKNPDAFNNRGAMKYKMGNLPAAVADFSKAIELNPRDRDAYMNRAVAYRDARQFARAVEDCQRAIDIDPSNPGNGEEYGLMGQALQTMGKNREALVALDRAIGMKAATDPTLATDYASRSYAWAALGDKAKAIADAREAQKRGVVFDPRYLKSLGG